MDTNNVLQIPVEDIVPNRFQPRLHFDEDSLSELSVSIKEHGIIQPLIVRKVNDKYEIVAGERRFRAAKKVGVSSVPVIISNLSDNQSAEVAIVENVQRKDLTAIEEAKSYKALLEKGLVSQEYLARKMGLSQSAISNKLRLLSLTEEVQNAILESKISERHARSLLKVKDGQKQIELLNRVLEERLTVKMLENEIKQIIELENATTEDESIFFKNKTKTTTSYFNTLENETANMSMNPSEDISIPFVEILPEPIEEIEVLDELFIPKTVKKEVNVIDDIKDYLTKHPNLLIETEDDDTGTILKIKIPK